MGHQVKRQNLAVDTLTAPQTTGKQELQGISRLSQVAGQPPRLSSLLHKPKSTVWCHKPREHPGGRRESSSQGGKDRHRDVFRAQKLRDLT